MCSIAIDISDYRGIPVSESPTYCFLSFWQLWVPDFYYMDKLFKGGYCCLLIMKINLIYESFCYDGQTGSGFLVWHLVTIQRETEIVFQQPKTQTTKQGGPRQEKELPLIGGQLDKECCKEVISLMKDAGNHPAEDKGDISVLLPQPQWITLCTVFLRLLDTKIILKISTFFYNNT